MRKSKVSALSHPEPSKKKQKLAVSTSNALSPVISLPEELQTKIASYLDGVTLSFLIWGTKQFNFLSSKREILEDLLKQFAEVEQHELALYDDYVHEACLAGWILKNYEHTTKHFMEKHDISPGSFATFKIMGEPVSSDDLEQELKSHNLFQPHVTAVFSSRCLKNAINFYDTDLFQYLSRLLSYNRMKTYMLLDLHGIKGSTLLQSRPLNALEKQFFKLYSPRPLKEAPAADSSPLIHSLEKTLENMNTHFAMKMWTNLMKWGQFFLVGGSILKCLLVNSFEDEANSNKVTQDVDFFYVGEDFYEYERSVEEFIAVLGNVGHVVVEDNRSTTYVKSITVTFDLDASTDPPEEVKMKTKQKKRKEAPPPKLPSNAKTVKFQFIWYGDFVTKSRILHIFDLDCCQVGYDGNKVIGTLSFIQSINTRTMINYKFINNKRDLETFLPRTLKYYHRGFELLVSTDFNTELLDPNAFLTEHNANEVVERMKFQAKGRCRGGEYSGFLLNNDSFCMRAKFEGLFGKVYKPTPSSEGNEDNEW